MSFVFTDYIYLACVFILVIVFLLWAIGEYLISENVARNNQFFMRIMMMFGLLTVMVYLCYFFWYIGGGEYM